MHAGTQLVIPAIWNHSETAFFSFLKAISEPVSELTFAPQRKILFCRGLVFSVGDMTSGAGTESLTCCLEMNCFFFPWIARQKSQEEAVPCIFCIIKTTNIFFWLEHQWLESISQYLYFIHNNKHENYTWMSDSKYVS